MNVGDRIRELRIAKGYSQEELGKRLGVKRAAVQKYEKGIIQNLKKAKIKLLADALDVTPSYLMGWEAADAEFNTSRLSKESKLFDEIKNLYGKDAAEILHQYLKLNATGKEKASDYVADLSEQRKYTEQRSNVLIHVDFGSR